MSSTCPRPDRFLSRCRHLSKSSLPWRPSQSEWIAPGTHIVSVGAPRPDQQELDPKLIARCAVFADSRAGALAESGDLLAAIRAGLCAPDPIRAEIGEVLSGMRPGRLNDMEITLFKSLGMALEDAAAGWLVVRKLRQENSSRSSA